MKTTITILCFLLIPFFGTSQSIEKFSIDSGGASTTAGNLQILYTIGEVHVTERTAGNIQISEGFINPTQVSIKVNATAFLQGPINNPVTPGLMNDNLRVNAQIPTTSPYSDGIATTAAVLNVTGPDAIVDWVWIELRNAADRSIIVEGHSALLQRDGNIVAVDGTSTLSFTAAADNYYLLIGHRNHLAILSATPVAISGTTTVDLSSNPLNVFGDSNAVADMGNGIYALFGGDNVINGQIQNADVLNIFPVIGTAGYFLQDIDLNGQIQNSDVLLVLPNVGRAEQF